MRRRIAHARKRDDHMAKSIHDISNVLVDKFDIIPQAAFWLVKGALNNIEYRSGRTVDHDNISDDDASYVFSVVTDKSIQLFAESTLDNMARIIDEQRQAGESSIITPVRAAAFCGAPLHDIARVAGIDIDTVRRMVDE